MGVLRQKASVSFYVNGRIFSRMAESGGSAELCQTFLTSFRRGSRCIAMVGKARHAHEVNLN